MADKKKTKAGAQVEEAKVPFDPTAMVRLCSRDGAEFVLHRSCAMVSKTIKNLLCPPGAPAEEHKTSLTLPNVDAAILEKAIQYFYYKTRYDNDPDNRPPFHVPPEMALDLMLVAHYLET
eukprot:RCo043819